MPSGHGALCSQLFEESSSSLGWSGKNFLQCATKLLGNRFHHIVGDDRARDFVDVKQQRKQAQDCQHAAAGDCQMRGGRHQGGHFVFTGLRLNDSNSLEPMKRQWQWENLSPEYTQIMGCALPHRLCAQEEPEAGLRTPVGKRRPPSPSGTGSRADCRRGTGDQRTIAPPTRVSRSCQSNSSSPGWPSR